MGRGRIAERSFHSAAARKKEGRNPFTLLRKKEDGQK